LFDSQEGLVQLSVDHPLNKEAILSKVQEIVFKYDPANPSKRQNGADDDFSVVELKGSSLFFILNLNRWYGSVPVWTKKRIQLTLGTKNQIIFAQAKEAVRPLEEKLKDTFEKEIPVTIDEGLIIEMDKNPEIDERCVPYCVENYLPVILVGPESLKTLAEADPMIKLATISKVQNVVFKFDPTNKQKKQEGADDDYTLVELKGSTLLFTLNLERWYSSPSVWTKNRIERLLLSPGMDQLKTLAVAFFSTWKLEEADFLDKVLQLLASGCKLADLEFLTEDIPPRRKADFLTALAVFYEQAAELVKSFAAPTGPTPEEVAQIKAELRSLTKTFFSTWKLDEDEFQEKVLQQLLSHCGLSDLDYLHDEVPPRRLSAFIEALTAYHAQAADLTSPLKGASTGTKSKGPDLDSYYEPQPTIECANPAELADTGVPFVLHATGPFPKFLTVPHIYLHSDKLDFYNVRANTWLWEKASSKWPILTRWLLKRIEGSTDRFTIVPYILPSLALQWNGMVQGTHEAKGDVHIRFERVPDTENTFAVKFAREQRHLWMGGAGNEAGTGSPDTNFHHEYEWKLYSAPYVRPIPVPTLEAFATTETPFLLVSYQGRQCALFHGVLSPIDAHDNKLTFRLVRSACNGQPGYRFIRTAEGDALCHSDIVSGSNIMSGGTDAQSAHLSSTMDKTSFVVLQPALFQGYVYLHFANCEGSLTSWDSPNMGMSIMRRSLGLSGAGLRGFHWMLLPYSYNPSEWPADPNLSLFSFNFEWKGTHLYIGAETLPLARGTKLVLTPFTTRVGSNYIIEPAVDKPTYFRLVSRDDPSLCMCVESIEEDTHVTLTDQRGPNTLITRVMNENRGHLNLHFYKFEVSDLFFNVRCPDNLQGGEAGMYIVQNFKHSIPEWSSFRMGNGTIPIDISQRKDGDLRNIYSEIHPLDEHICSCGLQFDTLSLLEEHNISCTEVQGKPVPCPHCGVVVLIKNARSWNEHKATKDHLEGRNERSDAQTPETVTTTTATTTTATTSGASDEVVKQNKAKLAGFRSRCAAGVSSDILVCNGCKKVKGCSFCGSSKDNERLKACSNCRDKKGGGYGKVTGKPTALSAGCIKCGTTNLLGYYYVCLPCKKQYGGQCYYEFANSL